MHHFTNLKGYKAISCAPTWRFVAAQPPGDHPRGAYFTNADPSDPKLWKKLFIPKEKREYRFTFVDQGDLMPLDGGRGKFVFYSPDDYEVEGPRQIFSGRS
jgi:hypothetical protein